MQFAIATVAACFFLGTSLASPAPAPGMAELMAQADNSSYTINIDSASCSALSCVEVLAAAGCIAVAIATDNPASALSCIAGNADKICGCAGCISELGAFLDKHGVC